MIMLDPSYKNECTVWFGDGNMQSLKGSVIEICHRIYNYVMMEDMIWYKSDKNFTTKMKQVEKVYIDVKGIGYRFYDELRHMGVDVNICTYERRI